MDDLLIPRRRKAGRLKQLNKHNRRQRAYQPESELLVLSRRIEAMNR